jgi:hypothetical protein
MRRTIAAFGMLAFASWHACFFQVSKHVLLHVAFDHRQLLGSVRSGQGLRWPYVHDTP